MFVEKRNSVFPVWWLILMSIGVAVLVRGFGVMSTGVSLVFLATTLAILDWAFVIPSLCRDVRLQWEAGEKAANNIKATFLTQEHVNHVLSQLAVEFENVCQREVKLQGNDSAEADINFLKLQIQGRKSDFWAARTLAFKLDFKVHDKVSDYVVKREIPGAIPV